MFKNLVRFFRIYREGYRGYEPKGSMRLVWIVICIIPERTRNVIRIIICQCNRRFTTAMEFPAGPVPDLTIRGVTRIMTAAGPMHHDGGSGQPHAGTGSHVHMLEDFRQRFIISTILTIPILLLSPVIQSFFGFRFDFPGSLYVTLVLATIVYFYGGYPFLKGIVRELRERMPGMMTLIAVAISVAYFYSTAVVFGLMGEGFFWELATLIDIMLLGHWIEMKSVLGASRALEELVKIMPQDAHLLKDNETVTVKVSELQAR